MTSPSSPASYNCEGWRGSGPPVGNTIPKGPSVTPPHSSPLMKFPMRPKNRPGGTRGATKSTTSMNFFLLRRLHHQPISSTPMSPPWNDMPPFQILKISDG